MRTSTQGSIGGAALMVATVLALLLATGCTRPNNPDRYERRNTEKSVNTYRGIVLNVRQVEVSGQQGGNLPGSAAAAAAGGVVGSAAGGGRGSVLGAIAGVIGGAVIGDKVQDGVTAYNAYEYIVEIEWPTHRRQGDLWGANANLAFGWEKILRTIVQQDAQPMSIGARIFLIDGRDPRVIPDATAQAQPKVDMKE